MQRSESDLSLAWRVERACAAAWPARATNALHGWSVGLSGGGSRRANSASAMTHDARTDRAAIDDIVATFHAAGRPPIIRITDLVAAPVPSGFGPVEGRTRTLIRPLDGSSAAPPRIDPRRVDVVVGDAADAGWRSARSALLPPDAIPDHHLLPTRVTAPAVFARVTAGGATVSLGYVAITAGVAVIEAVVTDPAQRQRGYGGMLVTALLEQATRRGADYAALQVAEDNEPARALYRRLGFATDLYGYHYRAAGAATPLPMARRGA